MKRGTWALKMWGMLITGRTHHKLWNRQSASPFCSLSLPLANRTKKRQVYFSIPTFSWSAPLVCVKEKHLFFSFFLCRPWKLHPCIFSPLHNHCSTRAFWPYVSRRDPVAPTSPFTHSSGWQVARSVTQFTFVLEYLPHLYFNGRAH